MRLILKATKTEKICNPDYDRVLAEKLAKDGKEYKVSKLIKEIKQATIILRGDPEIVKNIENLIASKYDVG